MRLYVESNFPLEFALRQRGYPACQALLELAADGQIELVIPAFSILEPHQTLERRRRERRELYDRLIREFDQISRSEDHREQASRYRDVIGVLIAASNEDSERLAEVRALLVASARIIPMDADVLRGAHTAQETYGLDTQDAVVLASILTDGESHSHDDACFVTLNAKDFGSPQIIETLDRLGTKSVFRFEAALEFVTAALSKRG